MNTKGITMKTTTKNTDHARPGTYTWLMATTRNGRRIENFGWKRLAKLYDAARPGSPIRKAIDAEARRCGYTPSTILACNRS